MLLRARKRRLSAARASTLLVAGAAAVAFVPTTAAGQLVPPVNLPGVSLPAPTVPNVVKTASCRGAGARRASAAVLRRAMLCLVYRTRATAGLSRWHAERHLARAASRHASDMARHHYFAHNSLTGKSPLARARAAGWHGGVGEVIAWGSGSFSSPKATLRAWLHSAPHRAILLGSGHHAGVGVKRTGGRAYWVIDVG
jgi:uncharacterized protein YkwD